ncbi:MAG: hypothetical protein ACR2O6_12940 [Ilumatobacteraceae bacterium]
MAAPRFSPVGPTDSARAYSSPDHVPESWAPDRPGEIDGFQPAGPRLGSQGPDQGFALRIAEQLRPKLQLTDGEHADDVITGCLGVALRRASMFSRAPVVHDLTIAFTVWGCYDDSPPDDLVALRRTMMEGLRHTAHHYMEARAVADLVPEETLRMTHDAVAVAYPASWRSLVGV